MHACKDLRRYDMHLHTTPATRGLNLLLQTPHATHLVTACDLKVDITAPEVCGTAAPPFVGQTADLPEE